MTTHTYIKNTHNIHKHIDNNIVYIPQHICMNTHTYIKTHAHMNTEILPNTQITNI